MYRQRKIIQKCLCALLSLGTLGIIFGAHLTLRWTNPEGSALDTFHLTLTGVEFYNDYNEIKTVSREDFEKVDLGHVFIPVNNKKVATVNYLCIEDTSQPLYRRYAMLHKVKVKGLHVKQPRDCRCRVRRLVSYGAAKNETKTVKSFTVEFTTRQVPRHYTMSENIPAYFVKKKANSMTNLFHFWANGMYALYHALKDTNRLHSPIKSPLYFQEPALSCRQSYSKMYFKELLLAFPVLYDPSNNYTYHRAPVGLCFRYAVFTDFWYEFPSHHIANYILERLNLSDSSLPCNSPMVTIIQRTKDKAILNTGELGDIATRMGFNSQVVVMEEYSIRKQVSLARCSDILVGVQGAGCQWGMFLKAGKGFIEISWPAKGWRSIYVRRFENYLLKVAHIYASKSIVLNHRVYLEFLKSRIGQVLNAKQIQKLDVNKFKHLDTYIVPSRMADVVVPPETFYAMLKKVVPNYLKKKVKNLSFERKVDNSTFEQDDVWEDINALNMTAFYQDYESHEE